MIVAKEIWEKSGEEALSTLSMVFACKSSNSYLPEEICTGKVSIIELSPLLINLSAVSRIVVSMIEAAWEHDQQYT